MIHVSEVGEYIQIPKESAICIPFELPNIDYLEHIEYLYANGGRDMETEKLKNCPFCGEDKACVLDIDDYYSRTWYYVVCEGEEGECGAQTIELSGRDEVIKKWNKRA